MTVSDRDLWLLNFYRNSELHGALLMGRLARTLGDPELLGHATRHCATEARHAALLTDAIEALNGRIDPQLKTVQEHYSERGGVPSALVDLLVLSELLEKRVLVTYRAHLARPALHREVRAVLETIVHEMEEEEHGAEDSWIEAALDKQPRERVESAMAKWRAVDAAVASELTAVADARFPTPAAS
jgi:hypothetical protein